MIFDIVEYIIMEWTMPNESQISRICRRVSGVGSMNNTEVWWDSSCLAAQYGVLVECFVPEE